MHGLFVCTKATGYAKRAGQFIVIIFRELIYTDDREVSKGAKNVSLDFLFFPFAFYHSWLSSSLFQSCKNAYTTLADWLAGLLTLSAQNLLFPFLYLKADAWLTFS